MRLLRRRFLQLSAAAAAPALPTRAPAAGVGRDRVPDAGGMMMPGTPTDFGKFLADETDKWAKVVREANIKPME